MIDPTVIFSTMFGALILLVGYLWRKHVVCVDRRLTALEQGLAVMTEGVQMRHEENRRRFDELRDLIRGLR